MNQTYVVKPGDTLWGISNQFGVSVTELARLNNVTADTLQIGRVLIIPSTSGINPNNMFIYTVKKGDSLYSIAKKYNTTVNNIIDINNLTNTSLYIGQQLRIPENYTEGDLVAPNFINYTVKRGDSLYSIAKEYGTTINEIIQDNSLTNNNLSVGQNLKIRVKDDNAPVVVLECFGEDFTPGDTIIDSTVKMAEYVVKKGDSLYSIAKKYNTTVSDIVSLNNLITNNLSIGQILKIPTSNNIDKMYTVKKGDTLYSIARTFNTTVDSIKSKNNISTNSLTIGQILKI